MSAQQVNHGKMTKTRRFAEGDAVLLVVLNSADAYWNYAMAAPVILTALDHWGVPYRVFDLATEQPLAPCLEDCAGVLIAQNHLAGSLSAADAQHIARAVENGMGLINLDSDLIRCPRDLGKLFGFDRINPCPAVSNILRIRETTHYITAMQEPGEYHAFDHMVPVTLVEKFRDDVACLAEVILGKEQLVVARHLAPGSVFEPRNYPVVFASRCGKGKAVQFTINPKVWDRAFYGLARGLDDLLWRSIIWAVRKPFAAHLIPPFVSLSFDDCSGRHDFDYAEVGSRHGYVPSPSLFLRDVPERLLPKIRAGLDSRRIRYNTHALDYYHLMTFDFGRGECSLDQLKANFEYEDAWWRRVGALPGPTIQHHWGEYGIKALPFLKQRQRLYFCPGREIGLTKAEMGLQQGYWPYNLHSAYYDILPDDHDFFVFGSFFDRGAEDFLTGCTVNSGESPQNNIAKAAEQAASHIRRGLRGAFFAECVTHEQKFEGLTIAEWDKILALTSAKLKSIERIPAAHDDIALYLRSAYTSSIVTASVRGNEVGCTLAGNARVPLRISVFNDNADGIDRKYVAINTFTGQTSF